MSTVQIVCLIALLVALLVTSCMCFFVWHATKRAMIVGFTCLILFFILLLFGVLGFYN